MKILVAVQDRSIENELVRFLRQQSFAEAVEVLVLHVVEEPPFGYYADVDIQRHVLAEAQAAIDCLVRDLQAALPTVKIEGSVVEGDPKEEIIKAAYIMPAQLLIMGSHGRGMLGRFFIGSVSLAVHAAAPCSLIILRPSKPAEPDYARFPSQSAALDSTADAVAREYAGIGTSSKFSSPAD